MSCYIYNNNGNLISKTEGSGTTQFAWDFENRLTQVVTPSSGSVSYKYDALGRRIQRTPSSGVSTNFIYDGQDVVKDTNSDGTTVEYLNGPGIDNKIRQKGSSSSTTYYFSQDHLGSTTALTGTTGKLIERISYDAYGNSAGSTRTRYSYTGRERDQLTALLYYRARFYDAQLGRFMSQDPIGFGGGLNFYAYVNNSPLQFNDAMGFCPQNTETQTPYTGPCPPTGKQLASNPIVKDTLTEAMKRSQDRGVEHGGWIYWNEKSGKIVTIIKEPTIARLNPDITDRYDRVFLNYPSPAPRGWEIVADFHTHPENVNEDPQDIAVENSRKISGMVRMPDGGISVYGAYKRGIWNRDLPERCQ